jgi:hypothetical protein
LQKLYELSSSYPRNEIWGLNTENYSNSKLFAISNDADDKHLMFLRIKNQNIRNFSIDEGDLKLIMNLIRCHDLLNRIENSSAKYQRDMVARGNKEYLSEEILSTFEKMNNIEDEYVSKCQRFADEIFSNASKLLSNGWSLT